MKDAMGAEKIKKEIHELIDKIENEQFLQSILSVLEEADKNSANGEIKPINLLENLDAYIAANEGLLKKLAQ